MRKWLSNLGSVLNLCGGYLSGFGCGYAAPGGMQAGLTEAETGVSTALARSFHLPAQPHKRRHWAIQHVGDCAQQLSLLFLHEAIGGDGLPTGVEHLFLQRRRELRQAVQRGIDLRQVAFFEIQEAQARSREYKLANGECVDILGLRQFSNQRGPAPKATHIRSAQA